MGLGGATGAREDTDGGIDAQLSQRRQIMNPSLTKVILSRDVLHSCLSHALSTEHQEIMGLLIGQVRNSEAHIHRSLVLSRRDKQKDRVEVGFEHLAAASTIAERLMDAESCQQNVLGWYHSHPHITVYPSHVDVKTQGCMQMLDSNFVGLIFSVFDKQSGDMNVCAFQSVGVGSSVEECSWSRVEIPIIVTHLHHPLATTLSPLACREDYQSAQEGGAYESVHKKESLISLQQTLLSEAQNTFEEALASANPLPDSICMPPNPVPGGGSGGGQLCSELELCRLASIYHLNLLRILDVQLLPTLHGLQSHRQSLEREKRLLLLSLGESKCESESVRDSSVPTPEADTKERESIRRRKTHEQQHGEGRRDQHNSAAVQAVLDTTQPLWWRGVRALRVAFSGSVGVHVSCSTFSLQAHAAANSCSYERRNDGDRNCSSNSGGSDSSGVGTATTGSIRVVRAPPTQPLALTSIGVGTEDSLSSWCTTAGQSASSAITPWSIEFIFSDTTDSGDGEGGVGESVRVLLPLLAIHAGKNVQQVDVIVQGPSCCTSMPSHEQKHHTCSHLVNLVFPDSKESDNNNDNNSNSIISSSVREEEDNYSAVSLWRQDLARALRLQVMGGSQSYASAVSATRRKEGDGEDVAIEGLASAEEREVMDISFSQTQTLTQTQ